MEEEGGTRADVDGNCTQRGGEGNIFAWSGWLDGVSPPGAPGNFSTAGEDTYKEER